jgi:hypothetical protein
MKSSSILMSSFGALLILIAVSENAVKRSDDLSKPNQTAAKVQAVAMKTTKPSATYTPNPSVFATDISYLKFNVSDFTATEYCCDDMPETIDFSFLKFAVADYSDTEIGALPEDSDFDYLKFNADNYASSPYLDEENPESDFCYLKFDVQKYMPNDTVAGINKLPGIELQ